MHGNEHHEGRFYRCVLLLLPPIPSEIPIVLFSPESPPPVAESETGGVFFFPRKVKPMIPLPLLSAHLMPMPLGNPEP
jgi:hypothetical protein